MNILECEFQEDGSFLINKSTKRTTIPDDMGNRHRVMVQEWIDAGNTPDPYVGPSALEQWKEGMARSDQTLPRYAEDIITAYGTAGLSPETLKRYADKRALRASLSI
jgi:hypothetical protein